DILELMSAADGVPLEIRHDAEPPPLPATPATTPATIAAASRNAPRRRGFPAGLTVWLRRRVRPFRASRAGPEPSVARRASTWLAFARERLDQLGAERTKRLLVVSHHVPQ